MELKLFNAGDNFVVESMRIGNGNVEFVHDTKTGENYFNQKTLVNLFGVSRRTVGKHLEKYLKDSMNFGAKSTKIEIRLKTSNKGRKTSFYGFNAVTYLAFRINNPKATKIQNTISSVLDKMFNVVTGKDNINTNKEWVKTQCESRQVSAIKHKGAAKLLYEADNKYLADKTWSEYKKLEAESLKFKEMYLDYERLDKEVATVRNDKTEQLKLI